MRYGRFRPSRYTLKNRFYTNPKHAQCSETDFCVCDFFFVRFFAFVLWPIYYDVSEHCVSFGMIFVFQKILRILNDHISKTKKSQKSENWFVILFRTLDNVLDQKISYFWGIRTGLKRHIKTILLFRMIRSIGPVLVNDMQTPSLKKSCFDFLVQIVEKRSETNGKQKKIQFFFWVIVNIHRKLTISWVKNEHNSKNENQKIDFSFVLNIPHLSC